MSEIKFSSKDLRHMELLGLTKDVVLGQISNFKHGFPAIVLDSPATIDNKGIFRFSKEQEDFYIRYYDEQSVGKNILKFVPASGAATRMFKDLYSFTSVYHGEASTIGEEFPTVKVFLDNLERFAFYDDLVVVMSNSGMSMSDYINRGDYSSIINCLLGKQMGYGMLPKALLKFHKYTDGARTALSEHFTEAYRYARSKDGEAYLHFTVSPEHKVKFRQEIANIRKYFSGISDIKFHIRLTEQQHCTDIIAVDEYNVPIRDDDGKLVFRPGGHGALINNLSECHADVIFIKNIDNVVPDDPRDKDYQTTTVRYKKLLGGVLLYLQRRIFEIVSLLKTRKPTDEELANIEDFMQNSLCIDLSRAKAASFNDRINLLLAKLDRPIRVCGMVKNEGEPGGGPFWVINGDGTKSLQIVESSQVNRKNVNQEAILSQSTHFNPVDLVCGIRKYNGRYFDLSNYIDHTTGFITKKTIGPKVVKSQELPGLWNGSMADWTTVFVEVPLATFNPVKTVNDLLRKEHFM